MKTFIIEEKFVGYADITIEAETEEEAIALYNRGHYPDSAYDRDDMFYDFEFNSIREEESDEDKFINEVAKGIVEDVCQVYLKIMVARLMHLWIV